jgi:hypothetical protein
MLKLHQVLAIEKGTKSRTYAALTEANKTVQKGDLFTGHARRYTPKDAEGDAIPPDNKHLQMKVEDLIRTTQERLTELFDVTLMRDAANQSAKADLVVDGKVLLSDVPAVHFIFLEKQLTDLRTWIGNLPKLDPL